jgi:RimJ/RimL family protein N-acetyltransferase
MPDTPQETIVRALLPSVTIRPLAQREAPAAVDAVFAGLSPRARYLRFHSPLPRLSPQLRESLADLDGHRRVAVLAEAEELPIGVAQFVATSPEEAEMAVAVVDAWQRRGIGTRLLTALTQVATDLGYTRLTGSVLPENAAMLALAARLAPWPRPTWDGEVVRVVLPLGPAAWTITDDDVLSDLLAR